MIKELISNITEKIKSSGVKSVDLNLLTTNSWFYVSDESLSFKKIFIFRTNGQLLVSTNGDVIKATWEILIHSTNSILIEINGVSELFNIVFLTNDFLVTLKDGTEEYNIFVKQEKYNSGLTNRKNTQPIEIVLSDFKDMLNSQNLKQTTFTKQLTKPNITIENNIKTDNNDFIFEHSEIILDNLSSNYSSFSEYMFFDILFELEQRKSRGEIRNKSEEIEFIVEMQQLEEDLISEGKLCPKCKALDSIVENKCKNCKN